MTAPWKICPICHGEGLVDTLGEVVRGDFTDEEWEDYMDGAYNKDCANCEGSGKVRADQRTNLVCHGSDGQIVQYEDEADASEHFLRMAEGLC